MQIWGKPIFSVALQFLIRAYLAQAPGQALQASASFQPRLYVPGLERTHPILCAFWRTDALATKLKVQTVKKQL
jgi:hypothetical protein